jgi:hypothetical protein
MSAPDKSDTRARLLTIQFWVGIALAPLAAILLLLGAATAAAALAIIAVVVLGLAVVMRRDDTGQRLDLEETLLEEIDMLRDDVRADITTAARATHRALAEKVASLQETIAMMQRQAADGARLAAEAAPPAIPSARRVGVASVGPGPIVHRTETVHVTTHQTIVDPVDDYPSAGSGFAEDHNGYAGSRARVDYRSDGRTPNARDDRGQISGRARAEPPDEGRPRMNGRASVTHRPDGPAADVPAPVNGAARAGGTADRELDDSARAAVSRPRHEQSHDGRAARDSHRAVPARLVDQPRALAPREESWTDQRLRGYLQAADPYPDSGKIVPSHRDDPGADERYSAMRSGDRWAEVREDEYGRELRVGERRAERRVDETGTQMRVVDRWTSVRHENPRPASEPRRSIQDGRRPSRRAINAGDTWENTGETRGERRRREEARAIESGPSWRDEEPLEQPTRRTGRRRAAGPDDSDWNLSARRLARDDDVRDGQAEPAWRPPTSRRPTHDQRPPRARTGHHDSSASDRDDISHRDDYEGTSYARTGRDGYDTGSYAGTSYAGISYAGISYDGTSYDGISYDGMSYRRSGHHAASYDPASDDPASYDPASYDPASYDATSHDGPSHDGPSHDGPSHDGTSYDRAGFDRDSYHGTSYDRNGRARSSDGDGYETNGGDTNGGDTNGYESDRYPVDTPWAGAPRPDGRWR